MTTTVTINAEKLTIERTGKIATIPENSWARLMYYLNCVDCVINYGIPSNITQYEEYNNLSFDDKNFILMLAEIMKPSLFDEKHVFIYDSDLCGGSQNTFYDITYSKVAAAATREFIIAGKLVTTLKIMAYSYSWKKQNYDEPMLEFKERLNDIHYGKADKYKDKNRSISCLLI